MLLSGIIVASLVAWKYEKIRDIYFTNQLSDVGIIINSIILVLFLLGIFRIIVALASYTREEKALNTFIANMQDDLENPLQ